MLLVAVVLVRVVLLIRVVVAGVVLLVPVVLVKLVLLNVALVLFNVALCLIRRMVPPPRTETKSYAEMCEELRGEGKMWTYFNTNPIFCLRSRLLKLKEPGGPEGCSEAKNQTAPPP